MNDSQSDKNTLLLFSIGPVQDFIAAARTTRDLWSGSYLLSTLIASALKEIKGEVIFPSIKNQPLIDGLTDSSNKDQLKGFLTPTLPNRFLAIISVDTDAAKEAEKLVVIIERELENIAKKVKTTLIKNLQSCQEITFDPARFDQQVGKLLEVQWQILPIEEDIDKLRDLAKLLPKPITNYNPTKGLDDSNPEKWGTLNSLISWLLDGSKSNRSFDAWSTGRWQSGKDFNKDSLTGKEEAVFKVSPDLTDDATNDLARKLDLNQGGLKPGELLGAASVIKRFWDSYYLTTIEGLPPSADLLRKAHPMPNTHAIASYDNQNEGQAEPSDAGEKYYAVIAFDGDQMGQWISGAKFESPISKDDHKAFSSILNDFSVNHARGIVGDSEGKLIYSGGDDVLAMVPAGNAVRCAQDIRDTFFKLFTTNTDTAPNNKDKYASIDASAGIAIAHYKSPLQDVVKAAQAAEKRAKRKPEEGGLGRAAVAISLFKRSGEILEWGCRWDSKGEELLLKLIEKLQAEELNGRFPHKLEALLTPYLPQSESVKTNSDFERTFADIIELEINHCLKRNSGGKLDGDSVSLFSAYWGELDSLEGRSFEKKLTLFINLLRTAAWMTRTSKSESQGDETPAY